MTTASDRIALGLVAALALTVGCNRDTPETEATPQQSAETPTQDADPGQAERDVVAEAPELEAAAPVPSGAAVVSAGALLFTSATGDVGFELPPLGKGANASPGMAVNVLGAEGDRVVVETLARNEDAHHCSARLSGLGEFRLRLYVSKDDLLPVITARHEQKFADGTSVTLSAGVPVRSGGDGSAASVFNAKGTPITLSVEPDKTGLFYEPEPPRDRDGSFGGIEDTTRNPLRYNGTVLADDGLFRSRGQVRFYELTTSDTGTFFTVRNPCLEVVAMTVDPPGAGPADPSVAMVAREAGILGALGTSGGAFAAEGGFGLAMAGAGFPSTEYTIKAGASVLWPDGRVAGVTVDEHRFTEAARGQGGLSCFDIGLVRGDDGPSIELCFKPEVVREHSPTALGGGGALGLLGAVEPSTVESETFGGLGAVGRGGGGGGLGTTGGGYGAYGGAGFGRGTGKRVPKVRMAKPVVLGSLDKDIIRRIVRTHVSEVRRCYNQGLTRDSKVKGKVEIKFVIDPRGKISSADVKSNTTGDAKIGRCMATLAKRWKFPKPPGGGIVVVRYPFVLSPG